MSVLQQDAKKQAAAARAKELEATRYIEDVVMTEEELRLDAALLEVERAAAEVVRAAQPGNPVVIAEQARAAFAQKADAFVTSFIVDDRPKLVWSLRRWREANDEAERMEAILKAEVRRAKAKLDRREEWFLYKIGGYARTLKRDTPKSVRVPEAGVRVEFRDKPGGWRVVDSAAFMAYATNRLGPIASMSKGVVEQRIVLNEAAAKKVAEEWAMEHAKANGGEVPGFPGMEYEDEVPEGKLVLVRIKADQPEA